MESHQPPEYGPEQPPDAWAGARRLLGDGMLSIVMPAFRLGGSIAENVLRTYDVFSQHVTCEIVPVDDGSHDNTRSELLKIAGHGRPVRPVFLEDNMGKGHAVRRGFEESRGEFVLFLDADLDLPPDQTWRLFDVMEREGADAVIGSKRHPDSQLDYPLRRRVISTVYFWIVRALIGLPVRDTQTGIKLFKRTALEWAMPRLLVKRFAFDLELLTLIHHRGFKISEAPVILTFGSERLGCVRARTVKKIMTDTLAIFYRLHIVRYYQRLSISDGKGQTSCSPS